MKLNEFLLATCLSAEATSFVRLELYTGCAGCGRRLVSTNNTGDYVRPDTGVISVHEAETDVVVAAYPLCAECVR